jgi:fluoroacetyl-CoA thioesterase
MKSTLTVGVSASHSYLVTAATTVPELKIDTSTFPEIPGVLATAYMIAMMEGTSAKALQPHLDANEGTLGIVVNVTHLAATLPGQTVTVTAEITAVEGRKVTFKVVAHDGVDKIGDGTHSRMIVPSTRFKAGVNAKAAKAGVAGLSG